MSLNISTEVDLKLTFEIKTKKPLRDSLISCLSDLDNFYSFCGSWNVDMEDYFSSTVVFSFGDNCSLNRDDNLIMDMKDTIEAALGRNSGQID